MREAWIVLCLLLTTDTDSHVEICCTGCIYAQRVNFSKHLVDILDRVAFPFSLANAICKGASKVLAVSVCTKLLFRTMLQLGGI